jgi:hypothetical protein
VTSEGDSKGGKETGGRKKHHGIRVYASTYQAFDGCYKAQARNDGYRYGSQSEQEKRAAEMLR